MSPATASPAVVRDVRWTDLAALGTLEHALFPDDAWSDASWWSELAGRPRREYVVLESDGGIVGYGGLDHGGEVSDVMTVAVDPRMRGRGLGGLVLDALEERARRRGARHLMLEVRADNAAATGLYRGRGFDVVSRRRGYYQPGGVDALVMRKSLSPNGAADD